MASGLYCGLYGISGCGPYVCSSAFLALLRCSTLVCGICSLVRWIMEVWLWRIRTKAAQTLNMKKIKKTFEFDSPMM
ncbi:hypothetical protein BS50DRAFT_375891 [Corynespora cassiicola Philippines]|uniref:Uncharacterized protein n=1 Tax=Corynespora cassiicola Philippines TaxID=1448308 RepID=A0A2T2NP58_CORCC|nr:hypothetical protein BS50DRAFT_375891 [Corynespora cassiicola Philippines]